MYTSTRPRSPVRQRPAMCYYCTLVPIKNPQLKILKYTQCYHSERALYNTDATNILPSGPLTCR